MAVKTKDMTEGNPLSLIILFSLPLMIGNVFQQLYTVVDTMVVGKALGVDALAALGATDWLYWLMLGMIQGVTQGFGILMAREFGAKRYESLRGVVGSSVVLAAVCAVVFLLIGQFVARPVLKILNTPDSILSDALLYLRIMFLGVPIVMAYNLFACVLRSLGDGQTPLFAMIVAAITNIILDVVFVLVFHWGIAGAAIASLIAQAVSGSFCFYKIKTIQFMHLRSAHFRTDFNIAKRQLALGTPMAFQNAIIAIGGMIIQSVVNKYGVAFIAGFTATNKLYGILEIAASSYGYAMITYVGQNLGAGRIERIRQGTRCANIVALITSAFIAAIMLLLGKQIIGLFISGTPEAVIQATRVGYQYLATMSVCLPILYILYVMRSAIQGMGDTMLPMISGIAEFIMRTGGVFLLPIFLGETGIFISEVLAWAGADLILIPSYYINVHRVSKTDKSRK